MALKQEFIMTVNKAIVVHFMMFFKHFDVVIDVNDETFQDVPSPVADPDMAPYECKA
jgi:hypothetical protein